jgi:signal transduction histidine kinase
MQPSVVVVEGPGKGQVFQVKTARTSVGRDAACDISLDDLLVSRHHAELVEANGSWELVDLRSSNGTRVNGEDVTRRRLRDGDTILLGKTALRFKAPSDVLSPARHAASKTETQMITMDSRGLLARWAEEEEGDLESLKRARHDLEILYRASRRLSTILESTQLVLRTLDIIFEEIKHVDRCSIHLLDEDTGHLVCSASRCGPSLQLRDAPSFSARMMEQVLTEKRAVLTYDAMRDEFAAAGAAGQSIRASICAPLQSQSAILGIIHTDALDPHHRFTRDDLRLIAAIGLLTGTAFENARLYERVAADKAALDLANRELTNAQEKLIQTEKLAAVGQMASGIVHDIKNPMTVMLGYTELIKDRLDQVGKNGADQKAADYLKEIEKGIHYCNEVIGSLLKFARPSKLAKSEVSVNELVDSTLKFLQVEMRKAGIRVEVALDERVPRVMIDENQIKQVLVNIILNAIQAMDKNERIIRVATDLHEDARHDWWIRISFQDNGKGMTEEQRRRVFDPFFTTKTPGVGNGGGTGLGLAVSYTIVNSHGGSIEVQSKAGEGTTFIVVLPASIATAAVRVAV